MKAAKIENKTLPMCGQTNKVHGGPCKRYVDKEGDKCWQHSHRAKAKKSTPTKRPTKKNGTGLKNGTYLVTKGNLQKILNSWDILHKTFPDASFDTFFTLIKGKGLLS